MHRLSDEDLLRELSDRVEEKNRALFDLRATTQRLEEVNRRLIASEALKSDFLSNIRNEINNPLAAIQAMAGEIAAGVPGADRAGLAAAIQREAFSLDFQLRNVFRAAEIEAGEAVPLPAVVDVRALVEETLAAFAPLAAANGVELRPVWEAGAPEAWRFTTDPAMLQQVFANLLSNAVKFGAGGPVTVVVGRAQEGLRLAVEDRGIGIAPADHAAVFERFRQLDAGRTKGYAGHGLGLSVVRALVELLEGAVTLESAAGEGSRFTVQLPEAAGAGGEGVFADAGNEYFFDA